MPDAVVKDDPLVPRVQPGELGQHGAQRPGIAAALGVPLAAAERRPLPPCDAARVVEDRRRAPGPAGVGDRLVSLTAGDQRHRPERDRREIAASNPVATASPHRRR